MVPPARAGRCVLMEIRISSQVTTLRDCCCLGFAFPFVLAIYSPPCGNASCSLFSPTGIWAELVGLGSSAALVTFQRGEIPASLGGKGTPVCASELPWNLLVLLSWELWSHTRALPWEGFPGQGSSVLLGTAWKTVPEQLGWDQSFSRSVDFLKRWIFPFGLELGA